MGISWSSNRRNNYSQNSHPPSQLLSSSSSSSSYPYPPDPYAAPPPHPYHTHPRPPPPPPPFPMYSSYYSTGGYTAPNYHNPVMGRSNFGPYYAHQNNGWTGIRPPMVAPPPPQVTYVEDQQAKKVRNYVNVHKDTLRLEIDEENPDQHLVTFVFDALYDGRLPVELSCATESLMPLHSATASALLKSMLSSKEEPDCKFVPVFPESYMPVKVPFQKGPGQKFRQPSGTGVDLGFFELDDLSKLSPGDVFPLVISAETCLPSLPLDENHGDPPPKSSPHRQITQAIVEKKDGDLFKVRVIKQILWIDEVRYELREIYGIGNSAEAFSDNDSGKECVICMTESKDTAVLPCRHMCLCSECAKALRLQSNKCPICRQPIEALMEIKINNADQ